MSNTWQYISKSFKDNLCIPIQKKKKNPIKVTYYKPSPISEVLYIPKEVWEWVRKEAGQGIRV